MLIGGVFGMASMTAPFVETGIALSIFCIGLLILSATRLPETASLILTGLFALCHGQAHGSEMPANASGFSYAFGFVIATASLHLTGILLGLSVQRMSAALPHSLTRSVFLRLVPPLQGGK
jgi:urease accessory protein